MAPQERYVGVDLEHHAHDGHVGIRLGLEVRAQAVDVALCVYVEPQKEVIVGILQLHGVDILVAEQCERDAVHVVAEVSFDVLIWIGRFHSIYGRHETHPRVGGKLVGHDVLDHGRELLVAARLQPVGYAPAVEVVDGQPLVVDEHGYKFVQVVGHEVTLRVDDEALVAKGCRREVDLHFLALEPALHLVVGPTALDVDGGQSLHDALHALGKLTETGQPTLVLLLHHVALVRAHRGLA